MGLLTVGEMLEWTETKNNARKIQQHGIKQFLFLYRELTSRIKHTLKWGDEIEYTLIHVDPDTREVRLFLRATDLMEKLNDDLRVHNEFTTNWQPEYAEYMLEGVPGIPFGRLLHSFNTVEPSMRRRREQLKKQLPPHCSILTLTAFPRLGCPDFTYPKTRADPKGGPGRSLFFPEGAINQSHPRFKTLTRNIRERRGAKVAINIPIFRDVNTPNPFVEDFSGLHDGTDPTACSAALPDHVYLDAMGFGMGCSCLQITFQACCIDEARILYDQLATICPIVMALSAATPAIRGYLLDTDCRWRIISASVDDRTPEELGQAPLKSSRFVIPKSRYDSISSFLSPMGAAYNDVPLVYDQEFYEYLSNEGVDHLLAQHVAHLFIRDPIVAYRDRLDPPDDNSSVEHFENIQSSNWQSMRFKPPPLHSSIGWRVEFRPTEVQLTDFENAAFVIFIILLSRTILKLNLNLLIPLSKVDENMATAVKRDAVRQCKFHFRLGHLLTHEPNRPGYSSQNCESPCPSTLPINVTPEVPPHEACTLMTIDEIMNGSDNFPGLIPLVRQYVRTTGGSSDTVALIHRYLNLLEKRASGELMTTASWLRSRIRRHPAYAGDSRVSAEVNSDLMAECLAVSEGDFSPPDLLPTATLTTLNGTPAVAAEAAAVALKNCACQLLCDQEGQSSATGTQQRQF